MAINASPSESHYPEILVEFSSSGRTDTKTSVHYVRKKFCNYSNPNIRFPSHAHHCILGQTKAHTFLISILLYILVYRTRKSV